MIALKNAPGGTVFRPWRGINPSEDDALEESYSDVFGVRRTRPQMVSYAWQEEFDYDDAGSRIQKRNGWGTIDYQYSEENRLRLAGKREYLHDKNGNLIQESSGGGLRRYEYNSQNRISQAIMNEGMARLLEYKYDGLGRRTEMSDSLSGTTRYGYDGRGLKTREMRPNQIIDYSYDGRGNLISSKESLLARRKVTYEYNALGQETLRNISGGHIEQRHYDQWGRLKGITGHQIQYEKLIGPLLYGESYVYGPGDQKKFSTDLDGNITAYEYDGFDRLASVSYPYDTGKVYTDFEERLDLGLYPNGQGKPVRVYEEKIKEIMAQAREKYPDYKAANLDLESHLFAAPGGTVFRPWRGINPSEDDALEESYSDVFGVRRTRPQMVSYAWQEEFDYDDAGSRIQKRNGWGAIDYQYSDENRLRLAGKREYTHDKNGNLIQESSGGGLRRYEYNSQNRISQAIMNEGMARLLEYKYDGLGRRTEMSDSLSGTTRYGYEGLGLNPVEEDFERRFNIKSSLEEHRNNFKQGETQPRESHGRGRYMPYPQDSARRTSKKTPSRGLAFSVSETRSYLYKGLSPVASTAVGDKGGMRSEAYGHDALGSVTEVLQYGMLQASYRYDAFGKTYEGALSSGERGYNGKPYNAVTGHYNYGYRDYDPMTGRFATVDPIRDGMNWYVYTANDPVNHIDPWGLATEDRRLTRSEKKYMREIIGRKWRGQFRIKYSKIRVHDRGITREDLRRINRDEAVGIPSAVIDNYAIDPNRPMGLPGGNVFFPSGTKDEVKLHEVVHTQVYIQHGNNKVITALIKEQADYDAYLAGGKQDESLNPYNYKTNRKGTITTLDNITTQEGRAKYIENFAREYNEQKSNSFFEDETVEKAKALSKSGFNSRAIRRVLRNKKDY